ncbi:peritrophin-44-like [Cochliomyia hominivorax]
MLKAKLLVIWLCHLLAILHADESINPVEVCNLVPNTILLQPNSCSAWLKCASSYGAQDMEEGACVFGLYFNKETGKCDYKESVECPFEKRIAKPCENAKNGDFVADHSECNAYIYCKDGKEYRSYCPSNLVFNPIEKSCVYKHQYQCPVFVTPTASDPICSLLPNATFVSDKNDCKKYGQCVDGVYINYSCGESLAWDHVKRSCVDIDEVICYPMAKKPEPELKVCVNKTGPISDGESCTGYYFCKKMSNNSYDRKPEHFTCTKGMFFDSHTLSCRDRMNVKCQFDRCEGTNSKYVNVAGDCKAYATCVDGKTKSKGVCPSNHYFDERTQGCSAQVVNYAACSS